jgi:ribosomal protein S4E
MYAVAEVDMRVTKLKLLSTLMIAFMSVHATHSLAADETQKEEEQTIVAKVKSVREVRPNKYQIELDNGQVWRQSESTSQQLYKGDVVRVEKVGVSYRMAVGESGGASWVKVARVK